MTNNTLIIGGFDGEYPYALLRIARIGTADEHLVIVPLRYVDKKADLGQPQTIFMEQHPEFRDLHTGGRWNMQEVAHFVSDALQYFDPENQPRYMLLPRAEAMLANERAIPTERMAEHKTECRTQRATYLGDCDPPGFGTHGWVYPSEGCFDARSAQFGSYIFEPDGENIGYYIGLSDFDARSDAVS